MGWGTALGFQFLIYALCKGAAYFVRGNNAENLLRAFEFYQVNTLVAAPARLASFIADFEKHRCRHTFDVVVTAGSIMSKPLSERVRTRLGPNLINDYGSAETSCVAAADVRAMENVSGAVGYIAPGMTVQIVDENNRMLAAGQEGLIRIRGDTVAERYFGDPKASAEFFRDGWFYPGDIGFLTDEGMLIISGRQRTILNVSGDKIKPEIIEEILTSFDGIEHAGALCVVNQLGVEEVWAAIRSRQKIDEDKLRAHCEQKLASIFVPKRFIKMDVLPTNEAGKLDRSRLSQMVKLT
jgi:acyl-coenzyme A synthetase/AMP-(fatty) acid ligase